MATASLNRPGSAQTTEKSQLILKGNSLIFCHLNDQLGYTNTNNVRLVGAFKMTTMQETFPVQQHYKQMFLVLLRNSLKLRKRRPHTDLHND